MSVTPYGLVGLGPNITVTMIATLDEDFKSSINDAGEKLPDNVAVTRAMKFAERRLKNQGAAECRLHPT